MSNISQSVSGTSSPSKQNKFSIYFTIVLIIFDVICDSVILNSFSKETYFKEIFLFVLLLFLQIIASPIQSGVSDRYGRKKSLIITLSATLMSLLILFLHTSKVFNYFIILVITNLVKGFLGNTTPLVWSVIADADSKDERFFFTVSESGYAIGYLLVIYANNILSKLSDSFSLFIMIPVSVVLIYLLIKHFRDFKDKECQNGSFFESLKEEPRLIVRDLKEKSLRLLYTSFTLLEISLYSVLILSADFQSNEAFFPAIAMMVGYIVGSVMMKFCGGKTNKTMMKYGFILSIVSLIPYIVASIFFKNINFLLQGGYFFHAIGNAILSPTTLSLSTQGMEDHTKGKRFGILTSFDTLALLITSFIIIIYKKSDLNINYVVDFSFITIFFAWIVYRKYEKFNGEKSLKNEVKKQDGQSL